MRQDAIKGEKTRSHVAHSSTALPFRLGGRGREHKSYAQIVGANERVNFVVVGLTGRGWAHLSGLANNKGTAVWRTAAM
jgi:hypothetical protein